MSDEIENIESIRDWINSNYPESRVEYGKSMIVLREKNRRFTLKIFKNSIFLESKGFKAFRNDDTIQLLDFIKEQESKIEKLENKLREVEKTYSDISNNPELLKKHTRQNKISKILK